MAVVGGVASVVNLVQAAGVLAKAAWITCERLHDAPIELRALSDQLRLVHDELQNIQRSSKQGHALLHTTEIRKQFDSALTDARESLDDLKAIATSTKDPESLTSRVRWALKDRKQIGKVRGRLHRAQERLAFLMQSVCL